MSTALRVATCRRAFQSATQLAGNGEIGTGQLLDLVGIVANSGGGF